MKFKHLAFLLAFFIATTLSAQGTVAHINMEEVINLMPQTSEAEAELNRLRQAYQRDFETSYREYQAKFVKYEDEASTLSPAENEKRKSDLELIERNLAQTQQNIEKQIAEKRKLLFEPVKQQARELVTKVADNLGFLYVLDSSKDAGLVMAKGKDLMPEVKRTLGM
ncbi:MAG: OmpH family outer membrane protein [Bacteroidota bacterium]|uniref:OmpH family outer membrane protein n=1 Tax=Leeuwenhoekiella palythoae TaxID=573501 RepID=UPI001CE18CEB|nr:OmpH family outer membrane protein [Leeuwenhoekiella palythoae]MEC7785189.1 OmpH family outer membrane protein [Bacteroidota bacterium]MEC8883316.1 OmpH family outer membrane protein [Bacteroidota bacterium]MEE3148266.1 OmpH family outer membrane protein [Bacteroidota bacterium]MEE3245483.1 OmpH family outer membrane protein [Bacteroidota bacterium]UBZ10008.1 OmpH family outer membrane protein [Leeuwenhoekiella palythoae]|tara:strand:- start:1004 stop:1504 length:501 start_codon:yes stop_codon:yes gene_type:complete